MPEVVCLSCTWCGLSKDCIQRDGIDSCPDCGGPVESLTSEPIIIDAAYDPNAITS